MKSRLNHRIVLLIFALGSLGLLSTIIIANAASSGASSVTWTDDFEAASLDSRWSWIRNDPTHWSLTERPGFLRITTNTQQGPGEANNLLVQPVPVGDYEIQTRVQFTPTENYQLAGLLVYQDDTTVVQLHRGFCDRPPPACVNNGIYFDYIEDGNIIGSYHMTIPSQGDAYLKLIRQGPVYTGYASTDGVNWMMVGVYTTSITPSMIGLQASNNKQGDAEIPADFDFFTLVDKLNRLYLPFILNDVIQHEPLE